MRNDERGDRFELCMKDKNASFLSKKPFPPHPLSYLWPVCSSSYPTQTEFSSQINTVTRIHTPSSEPSQNKANEGTHGPRRGSSAERQALADKPQIPSSQESQTVFTPNEFLSTLQRVLMIDMITEW